MSNFSQLLPFGWQSAGFWWWIIWYLLFLVGLILLTVYLVRRYQKEPILVWAIILLALVVISSTVVGVGHFGRCFSGSATSTFSDGTGDREGMMQNMMSY